MQVEGRVFVVTGSATGIGAACVRMLAERGGRVVVNYTRSKREAEETEAACRAHGAETLLVHADVSQDADCRRLAGEALDRWGGIDGLVNNAATTAATDPFELERTSIEDFQRVYAVNVGGAYQMIRAVAPSMRRRGGGAVVNVSSNVAFTGGGSSLAYTASKGALNALTLSLARVLGPEVRVNAVCPGVVNTRWMRRYVGENKYAALERKYRDQSAMRRISEPEEVADAILWLLAGTRYVTGELLSVDGGIRLGGGQRPAKT